MAVKKIGTLNKHQNPATNENEFDIENYMNVNWDKIKEVVDNNADELTTTQGKVTTLETDNTKNKQDISDIKENQETQNDLLQRTQSALINITTPKSDNINLKDSSDLNAKVDVYGISEQETREGYNLFNNTKTISNVTYNSEEDKWVFNLSNIYDHIALKDIFFENIKANTTYTMYLNILKNTANNIITFNPSNTVWSAGFNIQAGQTGVVINNIKTKEDLSTALYDLWFSHLNTITGEFEAQIMLLEGTYTSQNIPDYEQYGASPSPEFPSEIENVTGDIDITVCNKSLFNNTKTISNVTYNSEEDKWIFNLPNRHDHIAQKGTFFKNIKANTNYTLYFNILKNTSSAAILFNLTNTIWNNNIQISAGQTGVVVNNIKTREDLSTALYDLWFSHSNAITGEFEAQIMICEGSETDNNYVKYQEQLITFPLSEGQRLYNGDYLASDGIHHTKKQKEFDGTEPFYTQTQVVNNIFYTALLIDDMKQLLKDNLLSSHFKGVLNPSVSVGISGSYANYLYFGIEVESIGALPTQTEAEKKKLFKTWLAQQKQAGTPIIVEYELATEEIEPYTEEQQEAYNQLQNVLSYKTETNVFTDKALLEFKYIADTQTWVLNKINNTNQQILELAGGN